MSRKNIAANSMWLPRPFFASFVSMCQAMSSSCYRSLELYTKNHQNVRKPEENLGNVKFSIIARLTASSICGWYPAETSYLRWNLLDGLLSIRSDRIAAPHARQAGCPLESGRGVKWKKLYGSLQAPGSLHIYGYYFCLHFLAISWCQVLHPVVWAQAQKRHVDQLSIRLLQNGGGATALGEAVRPFFAA